VSFHSGWTDTVKALIAANCLAFLVVMLLRSRFPEIFEWAGFYGPNFLRGAVWQPVTYMFVHTGLWHLLMNMLGLFIFAGDVERRTGRTSFLAMYLLCGVAGALLSLLQRDALVVGASGGTLGVLTAFALLFPDVRIVMFPIFIPVRARYLAMFYAFITVASLAADAGGPVAHWAHLGGMAVALVFVKAAPLARRLGRLWESGRASVRRRRSAAEQAELDRILEKIHRDGITALTNQERDFLNVTSGKHRGGD
jgi:membrane associated rhomboid family serine protease